MKVTKFFVFIFAAGTSLLGWIQSSEALTSPYETTFATGCNNQSSYTPLSCTAITQTLIGGARARQANCATPTDCGTFCGGCAAGGYYNVAGNPSCTCLSQN